MKVLLFGVFDNEKVVQVDEEPNHLAACDDDTFLVCCNKGIIQLFAAGEESCLSTPILTFHTKLFPVLSIVHVRINDALVSIEPETPQSQINIVRVYYSWRKGNENGLQFFELPTHSSVTCISACQTTGKIAICTNTDVSIWSPIPSSVENSKYEKVLQLECPGIQKLSISGNYLSYATEHSVRVLEFSTCPVSSSPPILIGNNNNNNQNQQQQQSRERLPIGGKVIPFAPIDDEFCVNIEIDAVNGSINSKPPISTADFVSKPLSPTSETNNPNDSTTIEDSSFTVFGPLSEVGQAVRVEQQFVIKSLQLLLHSQYQFRAGPIHSLFFLPEYSHISSPNSNTTTATTTSNNNNSNNNNNSQQEQLIEVGMRCFVSTPTEGYLYNVRQPGILATYTYTNETVQCCSNDSFLFALTNSSQQSAGVEAFTLRTSMDIAEYSAPMPCLMGMQPFLGPHIVVVVGDYLLLLSKLEQQKSPSTSPKLSTSQTQSKETNKDNSNSNKNVNWSLYMLHPTTLCSLYEEILARATKISSSLDAMNASVYYQLILEGHILLQSKIVSLKRKLAFPSARTRSDIALRLSLQLEIKTYNTLLRSSAALLGDYYFQYGKEYHKAAQCLSESSRKLVDVVRMFLQQEESRQALLEYLDRVLFDSSMLEYMEEDPDVSNEILKHYVEFAPHRLSTIVIDSCLSQYSQRVALLLLEVAQEMRTQTPNVRAERRKELSSSALESAISLRTPSPSIIPQNALHEIPPKDLFAKALLHLYLDETSAAQSVLQAIPGPHIVEFCTSNPGIVTSDSPGDESEPHVLTTALRIAAPYALLDIVCKLGNEKVPSSVLSIGSSNEENQFLLMCYLENSLFEAFEQTKKSRIPSNINSGAGSGSSQIMPKNNKVPLTAPRQPPDSISSTAEKLCMMYLSRLIRSCSCESNSCKFVQYPIPLDEINDRFSDVCFKRWLSFHNNIFLQERPQWLDQIPPIITKHQSQQSQQQKNEQEFIVGRDYTHFYTYKLQGLICSGLLSDTSSIITALESSISQNQQSCDMNVFSALMALSLPLSQRFGRRESLSPMVASFPSVSLDFGLQFCQVCEDWGLILDTLLAAVRNSEKQSPERRSLLETYDSVLEHISVTLSPFQFISLLPEDGDTSFFLRHIERSCNQQLALSLRSSILSSMSAVEKLAS